MQPRLLKGKTIAVIGAGQVGGSIIRRLACYRPSLNLVAIDRNRGLRPKISRHAEWRPSLESAAPGADAIVLCTPVPEVLDLLRSIAKLTFAHRPLVLDTGTTKSLIMKTGRKYRAAYDFVGLHPLAGTEKSGWEGSDPALFDNRTIVHCPVRGTGVAVARELTRLLGARPLGMEAKTHDRLVASAIGLPHLLAYVASGMEREQANSLRAGSWASLTRVASSDPAMVAGFLHANASELRRVLRHFKRELAELERALTAKSPNVLTQALHRRRRDN